MRYNTGNPVGTDGSSSPFDLHDNSGNIDIWANDRTKITSPDRLGVERKTMFGLEQQVADWLAAQGFEPVPLVYVDGSPLVVDRPTQLIQRGDNLYSVKLPASFPVTLTGTWATDQLRIVAQVDRSLRDQLASSGGATMIGRGAGTVDAALTSLETGVDDINEQLQALDSTTIAYSQQTGVRGGSAASALDFLGRSGKEGIFITPSSLGHRAGRLAYRITAGGKAELITDLRKFYPAGAFAAPSTVGATALKAYYVKTNGSDSAAGTDWSSALASVTAALSKTDVDVVFVGAGVYPSGKCLGTYSGTRDVAIHAVGGDVVFVTAPVGALTAWSTTGSADIFRKTSLPAGPAGVVALDFTDDYGIPLLLPYLGTDSSALVGTTGYVAYESAGLWTVLIRLPNGAAPAAGRVLYYESSNMRVSAPNVKWYQVGITFIGGSAGSFSARGGNTSSVVVSEKCRFVGQNPYDAYQIKSVGLSICIGCVGAKSANDCFNYHALDGVTPHFIELNCIGVEALATNTGNGSTSHENVVGIRIGCDYSRCKGPGVADVNDAKTWNVCITSNENATFGIVSQAEASVEQGSIVYLHACTIGRNTGADIAARINGKVYVMDTYYNTSLESDGGQILPLLSF